ncbi:hypothetical protein BDW74DRAFT_179476 [Aspergillus multicolor]|uniref:uncharacterized protein n=1 Tax=Aspergillus multicolor TaxID=41759 RepID=UPI003CCCDB32
MPEGKGYTITSSGTNSRGNHFCTRDYGNGSNSFHYSNMFVISPFHCPEDGSYYYSNPDGSTYYNDGNGGSVYTPPSDTSDKK